MKKDQSVASINFKVKLDVNNVPEDITWDATDSSKKKNKAKAVIISIWDGVDKTSLKIDLWTKEMMVNEMYIMFHQTLLSMASTLERSTGNEKMSSALRDYCEFFAEQTKIVNSN